MKGKIVQIPAGMDHSAGIEPESAGMAGFHQNGTKICWNINELESTTLTIEKYVVPC